MIRVSYPFHYVCLQICSQGSFIFHICVCQSWC